ncbi:MAG: hypothetical protein M3422_19945 [Actinomycetota bacterium]|nr:hypothetical protein [Actinomycetota bacterium]
MLPLSIRVCAGDDPAGELLSLRDWLLREDELRGRVSLSSEIPGPDEMGALADALLIGVGGGLGVLARSLPIWLAQRRSDVEIEIEDPGGRQVRLNATRVADAEKLLKEVLGDSEKHR